jgi:hypothetical protein
VLRGFSRRIGAPVARRAAAVTLVAATCLSLAVPGNALARISSEADVMALLSKQSCADHRQLFGPQQNLVAQVTPTPVPTAPSVFPTTTPGISTSPSPAGIPTPVFGPPINSTTTLYQTPPPQPGTTSNPVTPPPIPTATPPPFDQNVPVFVERGGDTPPPITPAGQLAPSPTPIPSSVPTLAPNYIAILADKVSGSTKQGEPGDADGNVHILYKAEEIVGEHAHYDGLRTVTVTGHPFIIDRQQDSVLLADEIKFDTILQTATLTNGRGVSSQGVESGLVHFNAKDLHTDADGVGHGLAPQVSTCENPRGGYHISGKSMDVYPGDKIVIYKAILWLGAAAIFWLPKVVIPLRTVDNEAQKPKYFPDVGYDEYEGYWIKTRITFGRNQYYYGYYTVNYFTKVGLGLGYTAYYQERRNRRSASLDFYTISDKRVQSRQNNFSLNELENFSQTLRGNFGLTYTSNYGPYTNIPANTGFTGNVSHSGLRAQQTYGFTYNSVGSQSNSTSYSFTDTRQLKTDLRNSVSFNLSSSSSNYGGFSSSNSTAHFNDLADLTTSGADYQMVFDKQFSQQPFGINKEPELTVRPYRMFSNFHTFPIQGNFVIGEYSEPSNAFASQRADLGFVFGPLTDKVFNNSDFNATVNVNQHAYGTGDLKAAIQQNMSLNTPIGNHFLNSLTYNESNYNGPATVPFQFLDQQPTSNTKAAQDLLRIYNGNTYNLALGFSTYFNAQAQPVTYQLTAQPSARSIVLLGGSFNPGSGNGFYQTNVQFATPFGRDAALQFVGDVNWKEKGRIENKVVYYTRTIGNCYQLQMLYNQSLKLVTVSINILAFPSHNASFNIGQSGPLVPTTFNFYPRRRASLRRRTADGRTRNFRTRRRWPRPYRNRCNTSPPSATRPSNNCIPGGRT